MDDRKLETRRIAALQHVQRCTPTCPSSTSCRFRRARRKLREGGKPCTREILPHTRFALKVPRTYGCSLYPRAILSLAYLRAGTADPRDLAQTANDVALFELLLDGFKKCQADWRALIEEANKAERPGPALRNRSGSEDRRSMRLTERKRILIDIRRALHHGATFASPPAHLSLIKKTGTDSSKALEESGDVSVPAFGNTQGGYICCNAVD